MGNTAETKNTDTRVCKCCGRELPVTMFTKAGYGWHKTCKECEITKRKHTKNSQNEIDELRRQLEQARMARISSFTPRELILELKRRGYEGGINLHRDENHQHRKTDIKNPNIKEQVTITLTAEEALMVVTALGTYQNRIGQHSSWAERKRIPTLQRMAQEAESEADINTIKQKIEHVQGWIARCISDAKQCNALKERIKQETGITNERRRDQTR